MTLRIGAQMHLEAEVILILELGITLTQDRPEDCVTVP